MFVSREFRITFRDINKEKKVTNKAILGFLEDTAGTHSDLVGYGLYDFDKTHLTWLLLGWKVKIFQRPGYNEKIKVTTWSRDVDKLYAYRNFEILNEKNELIGEATSKWIAVDPEDLKIIRLNDEIANVYKGEIKPVLNDELIINKIKDPENYMFGKVYKVNKNMIDIYNHVHNTYYLDFVNEILENEIDNIDVSEFEIMYKTQIKENDNVKILYTKCENFNYVIIKSEDESVLHAIIKLQSEN